MNTILRLRIPTIMLIGLSASTLARCSCEEEQFIPSAVFEPSGTIGFGKVSVATEKKIDLMVTSNGGAAYQIIDAIIQDGGGKFRIEVSPELTVAPGLRPSQTASIAVYYRPCPDAWNGNQLKDAFDFGAGCTTTVDSVDLTITDNTLGDEMTKTILVSGQPVFPPNVTLHCAVGSACNMTDPQLGLCNTLSFGVVNAGDTPCDLLVELRNSWRDINGTQAEVGDLEVERMEIIVQEATMADQPLVSGEEAGFIILNTDGSTLAPDSDNPFVVAIPPGLEQGAAQFKIRFTGEVEGTFLGQAARESGLRLFTSDPDNSILVAQLTGTGAAPTCQVNPASDIVNFGPVPQGATVTTTVTYTNSGSASLLVTRLQVECGSTEFTVATSMGNAPFTIPAMNGRVDVFITYSPTNTGADQCMLTIDTEPEENGASYCVNLELRGGATPQIELQPDDVLGFPLGGEACQTQRICNIGFGDLNVTGLELRGPDGTTTHPSVDDFDITMPGGCGTMCNPNLTLCPPGRAGCTTPCSDLLICYDNNDVSNTDLVDLIVTNNDPSNPTARVTLDAADDPCLSPAPVITVLTAEPCVGMPVMVNATSSNPGGAMGGGGTITSWSWDFLFTPPPRPDYMPPDTESTLFIPQSAGLHILKLDVINDCGAMNQTPGQEQVLVAATCD